jgi:sugar/nucleoside kinase (ribokinase family)
LPPDFLVVGHVTRDLVGEEARDGGTATYAAAVASRFGLRAAILTSAADDYVPPPALDAVQVDRVAAAATTHFRHIWRGNARDQYLLHRAAPLTAADVPADLRDTPIVLLGPVTNEVEADVAAAFPRALRGATLQGWLRRFATDGQMQQIDATSWDASSLLQNIQAAILSEEDMVGSEPEAVLDGWARRVGLLAITAGEAGARVAERGLWSRIAAFPAAQSDGTGAGDTFAAVLLIGYHETGDAAVAARMAAAAASIIIEAPGIMGAPSRAQVEARLAAYPAIRLQTETV